MLRSSSAILLALLVFLPSRVQGFALLGPFTPWQSVGLGFDPGTDLGGPQDVGDEFRWNVPIITYDFDRSFIDYFGTPGINAIEEAIALLNALPPASQIDLRSFPLQPAITNAQAQQLGLLDLKSTTLGLLLEQMGLAAPRKNVWVLRDRKVLTDSSQNSYTNYLIVGRNLDPFTWTPTRVLNGTSFDFAVREYNGWFPFADAIELPEGTLAAVADVASALSAGTMAGLLFTSLSRDDVGGLRYLLSGQNLNLEQLPPDTRAPDGFPPEGARSLRPGVEKILFRRFEISPGLDTELVLDFTDTYLTDGILRQQPVQRTLREPDIVFAAADLGTFPLTVYPIEVSRGIQFTRFSENGPGTINPGGRITFGKLGVERISTFPGATDEEAAATTAQWASFDPSHIAMVYPAGFGSELRLHQLTPHSPATITWVAAAHPGWSYAIESSADLLQWQTYTNLTLASTNALLQFQTSPSDNAALFFRAVKR